MKYKYLIGDKVLIVSKWNDHTEENPEGRMDKYLGTVMTIRNIVRGGYKMQEDKNDYNNDGWFWNDYCIVGKVDENNLKRKLIRDNNGKLQVSFAVIDDTREVIT